MSWHSFWDPRVLIHSIRPLVQKYNGHVVKRYIRKELEKRFQETKTASALDADGTQGKHKSIKSVTTLALEAYMAGTPEADNPVNLQLDERFANYAACQIRLLIFAGTDSTATIMVYIYHMLAKHPEWRRKLRDEHDEVLGQDPNAAAIIIKSSPSLLNNCKLTVAFT